MALYLYSGPPFQGIFRLKMGLFQRRCIPPHRRKPLRGALFIENSSVSVHYLRDPPGVGANRAAWSPPHPPQGRWPLALPTSGGRQWGFTCQSAVLVRAWGPVRP